MWDDSNFSIFDSIFNFSNLKSHGYTIDKKKIKTVYLKLHSFINFSVQYCKYYPGNNNWSSRPPNCLGQKRSPLMSAGWYRPLENHWLILFLGFPQIARRFVPYLIYFAQVLSKLGKLFFCYMLNVISETKKN